MENINNINNGDLLKLKENGFPTVESMQIASFKQIEASIKGFRIDKFDKIKDAIKKLQKTPSSFKNGKELLELRKNVRKITTGSSLFDKMLGGGIES